MKTRISRYQLLGCLHSGATADLLLGSYEANGEVRYAALKQIRATDAQDQQFLRRFLGEVQLAIALGHKHLVEIHDVLGDDGSYVIAMEYVHGVDLRTLVANVAQRGDSLPVEHICAIGSAIASGLHHAHELRDDHKRSLGVLHRNVSPSNILLGYDGSIKLGDFGTPMAAMQHAGSKVEGRVSYFSPEQCKGGELDRRSDVYSLGVVLYELATTSRLFVGDDEQVLARIVRGDVAPPQALRPDLPVELSAILLRAMAVDPAERFASAGELRAALDKIAGRGKRASAGSLAAYVREYVGERPEPWREQAVAPSPSFWAGNTWIETARAVQVVPAGSSVLGRTVPIAVVAPSEAPLSMPARRGGGAKLAMIGIPLVAIAGVAVWQLSGASGHAESAVAPTTSATAPAVAAVAAVAPPAAPPPAPAPIAAAVPAPAIEAPPHAVEPSAADTSPHAPAPAADAPRHTVASTKPSTPRPARIAEATEPSTRSHTESSASNKISTGRTTNETAPAAAPAPEPAPAPVVAPAPKPADHVSVSAPAPTPAAHPAAAAPPTPPPAATPHVIAAQVLDANRKSGDWHIGPDADTSLAIRQAHKDQITAALKLCVGPEGGVSTVSMLQSTGFAAFDAKIQKTIRENWHYGPFVIDGQRSAVCATVGFVYRPPVM